MPALSHNQTLSDMVHMCIRSSFMVDSFPSLCSVPLRMFCVYILPCVCPLFCSLACCWGLLVQAACNYAAYESPCLVAIPRVQLHQNIAAPVSLLQKASIHNNP